MITGTLSPIKNLAFSRLRTRMRGLARMLMSPNWRFRLRVMALPSPPTLTAVSLMARSAFKVIGSATPKVTAPGNCTPMLLSWVWLNSSISTSSITSGSGWSLAAMSFSAMATCSGVSRITIRLRLSSVYKSLILSTVLSKIESCLTSALATKKLRTVKSWYSLILSGRAG
ncbi:hypothetical protein GALL_533500 [mine drainage metagenome]|uniref:Uncharacterized protein n=1 Tax=mine drainage metagenome TaxID=410659 RepID=A0A1J5P1V1_9ZZZZ